MKVAIISDIHGNIQALNTVLEDIKAEKCEKILCLGDLAMAGPEPEKAVQLIKKMDESYDFKIIQGNTDKMIADYSKELDDETKKAFPIMGNALENDVKILSKDSKKYLKNLPEQLNLEIENVKVFLVHGSPRKNNENIFPDLPLKQVEEMIASTKADLILCGHTHIPCGYQTNTKQTVVNVGSVGRPFTQNPQCCYVIATFKNKSFTIEHKFVNYDKELAAKILSERDFDGAKKLSTILINPKERHM